MDLDPNEPRQRKGLMEQLTILNRANDDWWSPKEKDVTKEIKELKYQTSRKRSDAKEPKEKNDNRRKGKIDYEEENQQDEGLKVPTIKKPARIDPSTWMEME